ncbi:MAG: hypothetical protein J3Q66DRAFT_347581, partial [Benniella sp.]
MDTVDLTRPSLPAKLRWRPYVDGSTMKSKKVKKDSPSQQRRPREKNESEPDLNIKALVHKVRVIPHLSDRPQHCPVAVQLQWEEAETVESMSHGGHPHNQLHHYQRKQCSSQSDTHLDSTTSPPSPPPPTSPLSRLATIAGDPDLGPYKASVPGLTGEEFLQLGLPMPKFEDNTTYRVALNALLENHHRNKLLDAQAPALALTSVPMPISAASPATFGLSNSSGSRPRLSASQLLGISSIDELLTSCGHSGVDTGSAGAFTGASTLASPPASERSLHSSPVDATIDFSTEAILSPMDITAESFDRLLAQTPVLLAEGDSKQQLQLQQVLQQQQQQQQQPDASPTLSATSTFADFIQELALPFKQFASKGDPLVNGLSGNDPSSWHSLFPGSNDEQLHESTQLLSPSSSKSSSSGSPQIAPEAIQEDEIYSEWLAFLDEASLANTETETDVESPIDRTPTSSSVMIGEVSTDPPKSPGFLDRGLRNWAEEYLKSSAMSPTGHGSLIKTGSMSALGSAGGMVRTLNGGQKTSKLGVTSPRKKTHKKGSSSTMTTKSSQESPSEDKSKQSKAHIKPQSQPIAPKTDKADKQETDSLGGLLTLFRGLFTGRGRS